MANELSIRLSGTLSNSGHTESFGTNAPRRFDQSGLGAHAPVVSVGTGEEVMPTGDVGTLGFLYVKNLDSTNYVTYGPETGSLMIPFGKIKAGEEVWLRLLPGITNRWAANTASVKVKMILFED